MFQADVLTRRITIAVAILVTLVSLSGCGGGGGGGSPVAPTPSLPDTPVISLKAADLSSSGAVSNNSFNQGALALDIPTATNRERYAVLLTNKGTSASTIKVNGGGSTFGAVRASIAAMAPSTRPVCGTPVLRNAKNAMPASSIRANRVATLKAATAAEKLNDIVSFSIFSGGVSSLYNASYTTRKGALRRIGVYCKLFVDPEAAPNGLSAVSGAYAIKETDLDTMVKNFDEKIYPLMTGQYGPSYDMDGDGKVAVFLSPLVTQNGFAGFFDTEHFSESPDSNQRDMFCMWTPYSGYDREAWLPATCETIAHEFQHLINFSMRMEMQKSSLINSYGGYSEDNRAHGNYWFDKIIEEDVWLDESLSMGAEIRYRLAVGDPATEDRFRYFMNDISTTSLTSFHNTLADYGCVGLFAQYLLDQGGADRIKKLVTSGLQGKANINAAFGDHGVAELRTFDGLYKNWTKAVFAEMNRQYLDMSRIPASQKFSLDFDLDRSTALAYGSGAQDIVDGGAFSMFILKPPASYTADSAVLYLQAAAGSAQQTTASIDCTVMRLNDTQ